MTLLIRWPLATVLSSTSGHSSLMMLIFPMYMGISVHSVYALRVDPLPLAAVPQALTRSSDQVALGDGIASSAIHAPACGEAPRAYEGEAPGFGLGSPTTGTPAPTPAQRTTSPPARASAPV